MQGKDNSSGLRCPECKHRRKPTDSGPKWQCPKCGVAYVKAKHSEVPYQYTQKGKMHNPNAMRFLSHPVLFRIGRVIEFSFLFIAIIFITVMFQKDKLPRSANIVKQLKKAPIQTDLKDAPMFEFEYRGQKIMVEPKAEYELWGLVVSQNNINAFIDGYDENDVNLRDICVTWGENTADDVFHQVKFSSRQWICNFSYDYSLRGLFDPNKVSNNHLLSDSKSIRERIRDIKLGDQVYLKGKLVNYRTDDMYGWRTSSLVRTDGGNGACEVFFVEELIHYKKHNRPLHMLYQFTKWLLILLFIARISLQLVDIRMTKLREE